MRWRQIAFLYIKCCSKGYFIQVLIQHISYIICVEIFLQITSQKRPGLKLIISGRLKTASLTTICQPSKVGYPGRPSMDILVRSWQDLAKILLGKILAKIVTRYFQEWQDVMVRSYQESHVSKKTFIVKSYLERKNLKGSQQKSTFLQIYIVRH